MMSARDDILHNRLQPLLLCFVLYNRMTKNRTNGRNTISILANTEQNVNTHPRLRLNKALRGECIPTRKCDG